MEEFLRQVYEDVAYLEECNSGTGPDRNRHEIFLNEEDISPPATNTFMYLHKLFHPEAKRWVYVYENDKRVGTLI